MSGIAEGVRAADAFLGSKVPPELTTLLGLLALFVLRGMLSNPPVPVPRLHQSHLHNYTW